VHLVNESQCLSILLFFQLINYFIHIIKFNSTLIINQDLRLKMEIIFLVLIVYFFIGAGVCLLICVNPNDPGILGKMSKFMFKKFP